MEHLLQKIQKDWVTHQLTDHSSFTKNHFHKKIRILICVSGGCDSIALFHLLYRLRSLLKLELDVLHFNHQLRPESSEEQQFIESLAIKYGIEFHFKVAHHLTSGQPGLQEAARNWRIEESLSLLHKINGDCIATGHHANDQTETFLMKWLRGTHISQLKGMSWKNASFIRPLLNCQKSELLAFLKNHDLEWREDSSNQSTAYMRNHVRLDLVPMLEELTKNGLSARIQDLSDQSHKLRKFLDDQSQLWFQKNQEEFQANPNILPLETLGQETMLLQEEIVHKFITNITGKSLNYDQLRNVLELLKKGCNGKELHLSHHWKIVVSQNNILLKPNQ